MANLIIRPNSGTGTSWTSITNAYDTDTTTGAQVTGLISTNYSERALTLTFPAMDIPSNAVISKATLTVIAKQGSSTSSRRITVQADINGNSSNRVIDTQLTTTSSTTLTADITNYIFDTDLSSLKITPYTAASSSFTATFTLYDVNIDVEYVLYDKKVVEFKCSLVDSLMPSFNSGFRYTTVDTTLENGLISRTIYTDSLPTMCKFDSFPSNLLEVLYLDTSNMTTMSNMFRDCVNLVAVNTTGWNTSKVKDMSYMFYNCNNLTSLDVSNFDTSNVTIMVNMFNSCFSLTLLDVSNWDTGKVTNMESMFNKCKALTLLDVSKWDTSNVTNLVNTFYQCASLTLLDVSNWDTSKVTNMNGIFRDSPKLLLIGVGNFDTSKVTNMSAIFRNCKALTSLDLSKWDTSIVTNTSYMFYGCDNLTQLDLSNWDNSNVTNIQSMFQNCTTLTSILMNNSDYNSINKVITELPERTTDNYGLLMAINADDFSQVNVTAANTKNWNVLENKIKIAEYKFDNTLYNLIPEFNEGIVYIYEDVVEGEVTTRTIYSNSLPTLMRFGNEDTKANSLLEVLYLDTSNIIDMSYMFKSCTNLTKIYDTYMVSHTDIDLPISNMVTFKAHEEFEWTTPEYINDKDPETKMSVTVPTADSITDYGTKAYFNMDSKKIPYNATITKATLNCTFSRSYNILAESYCRIYVNETDYISETALSKQGDQHTITVDLTDYVNNLLNGEVFIAASAPTSIEYGFYIYEAAFTIDYDEEFITFSDTSNVTDMSYMFADCINLTQLDVSNFDTNKVTNMQYMFYDCQSLLTIDASNWDTGKVTNMEAMFCRCFAENIENSIKNWDVSKVTNMKFMLDTTKSIRHFDLSSWDVNSVIYLDGLFGWSYNLYTINLTGWNTSNVTSMTGMFTECSSLTTIIGIEDLDTSKVEHVTEGEYGIFTNCYSLTELDLSKWDVSNVTNMNNMFYNCNGLTSLDLSGWDTSNVTTMYAMFCRCYELNSIIGIEDWDVSNVTDMNSMFYYCKISELDLSNWKTNSLTDINWMFSDCYMLRSLNVTGWNTINITELVEVFAYYEIGNHNLIEIIGLNTWDVSNVTVFEDLFWECRSLKSLDLSGWDMSNATYIQWMFCDCESLETLKLNGWHLRDDVAYTDMFSPYEYSGCPSLTNIEMNNSDYNSVNKIISVLPIRTATEPGMLDAIGVDDTSLVDKTTSESKNWNIKLYKVAEYKFDNTLYDLIPEFNEGYNYIYEDDLYIIDNLTWMNKAIHDITGEIVESGNPNIERCCDFISVTPNTTYILPNELWVMVYHYTQDRNYIDVKRYGRTTENGYEIIIPENVYFIRMKTNTDYGVNPDDISLTPKIVTRTIYSDSLPASMRFGKVWTQDEDYATDRELSLIEIVDINASELTHGSCMFQYCNNLTKVSGNLSTDKMTNMRDMFRKCNNLTTLDVSNWNTSNVADMWGMFGYCESLATLDVSNWDTSKVNTMAYMFLNCTNLTSLDVNNWDISNVTNIQDMFSYCESLTSLDLTNWQVGNVTNMNYIFCGCESLTSLGDLSNWNVSNVIDMSSMFRNCQMLSLIGNINNWDTSNVTTMQSMFHDCFSLMTLNLSCWDTSNVTNMQHMFYNAIYLTNLDINNWMINATAVVTDIFGLCENLNNILMNNSDYNSVNKIIAELPTRTSDSMGTLDITDVDDIFQVDINAAESKYWNIIGLPQIKVVEYKFTNSSDLVPVFNEGFVYTYEDIVDGTTTIRTIYGTELPTSISFTGQTRLMEVNYIDTSNLTSTYDLFYNCTNLTYVDLRNSDFSKVETIERMFAFCKNLIKIDGLNDIDVSNVNNMGGLFTDCDNIPEIDVRDWDVSKVTNFGAVFRKCYKLSKIDVSKWNTSSGVIMSGIFTNCTNLTEIDIYNWDTTNANSVSQMFYGCSKLTLIKSFNHIGPNTVTTYLFGKCTSLKHVQLPDSDVYTINKVIEELPTRNATDFGILDVLGADIIDQIDITTARNKYWNVIAIHNAIKNIYIGDIPINTLFLQGDKKIKSIYFGDNKLY